MIYRYKGEESGVAVVNWCMPLMLDLVRFDNKSMHQLAIRATLVFKVRA